MMERPAPRLESVSETANRYTVGVRTLCAFAAKSGDLDTRFTPTPTAHEGSAGHRLVQGRRGAPYQTEISLVGNYQSLTVRGRADGYDPQQRQIEEIKTYRGPLEGIKANQRALHWAQLKTYAWLLCERDQLERVRLALVYLDLSSAKESVLVEDWTAEDLRAHFAALCERFLGWSASEMAHQHDRSRALGRLSFAHTDFRAGQRDLGTAVYRAALQGRCVLAQAPTGIGKTAATLFPALKALGSARIDKVFFLSAKGAGTRVALHTLDRLTEELADGALRVVELIARDKACVHPDLQCHGDSCPRARGFYDRLSAARNESTALARWQKNDINGLADRHMLCPYYLNLELVRWADVVVGDYNYYFDSAAMLYALTVVNEWRVTVLVDEAHNLVERGRAMYSASLSEEQLGEMMLHAPAPLADALMPLIGQFDPITPRTGSLNGSTSSQDGIPDGLLHALDRAVQVAMEVVAEGPLAVPPAVQRGYFALLSFARLCESFRASHSVLQTSGTSGARRWSIENLIAAPFLAPRFKAAHASVLFSATIAPAAFYCDTLGMPQDTIAVDVASPFLADQLAVNIIDSISTRYRHRARSVRPIVELMVGQFETSPGNYLAFFSSFEYLGQIAEAMRQTYPAVPIFQQRPAMGATEREEFLEKFTPTSRGIGFAVLGGSFGEGIDLPGARLIGAFIMTLGLPQTNSLNEQLKDRMEAAFGEGHNYTYLYPGIRKVVQAAGRVIRSNADRGVVFLIDDRFLQQDVLALLPDWWHCPARNATQRETPNETAHRSAPSGKLNRSINA